MADLKEVEAFLKEFHDKMKFWNIFFRDERGKNAQALVDLELTPNSRKEIIESIVASDYSQGPLDEKLYGGTDMWVFGKIVKKQEVYIKVSMGMSGSPVICISFHVAEKKMNYPLK